MIPFSPNLIPILKKLGVYEGIYELNEDEIKSMLRVEDLSSLSNDEKFILDDYIQYTSEDLLERMATEISKSIDNEILESIFSEYDHSKKGSNEIPLYNPDRKISNNYDIDYMDDIKYDAIYGHKYSTYGNKHIYYK